MFKEYLERRPKSFQMGVFILLWAGLFLLVIVLQFALQAIFFSDKGQDLASLNSTHPGVVALSNAVYTLFAFGLPAFVFAYLSGRNAPAYLGLVRPSKKRQILWVVILTIGMVPVMATLGSLIKEVNFGETARKLQELRESQINAYLKSVTPAGMFLNILLLALLPAFCEELFFRGIVQKFAYSYTQNHKKAIFISALLFALVHLSVFDFLPILIAGIILGWIYAQTGSLWLNVLTHFLFNGIQVVAAYIALRRGVDEDFAGHWMYLTGISLVGLVLLFVSVKKIYKLRSPLPEDWSVESAGRN